MNEEEIKDFRDIVNRVKGNVVTVVEMKDIVKTLLTAMKEIKKYTDNKMSENKGHFDISNRQMEQMLSQLEGMIKDTSKMSLTKIKDIHDKIIGDIQEVKMMIPQIPNLSPLEDKINEEIEKLKKEIPKIPEELKAEAIRNKLESLEGNERLDKSAIKDLQEDLDYLLDEIRSLRKMKGGIVFGGGGVSSGGGRIVKTYDLSPYLNGVLKTFSMPAFWRIISIQSTTFPITFRPTVDYTSDAGTSSITFTSEITADTTLASGQTVIVIYSE